MKAAVSCQWTAVSLCGRLSCLLLFAVCLLACSVPNLEEADCIAARDVVREFYSFHIANDMHPTLENVQARERFLTERFAGKLRVDAGGHPPTTTDYFTLTDDFPKAFRVGGCTVGGTRETVRFDVLLFWKNDERSEQRHVLVTAQIENDNWRIDDVSLSEK